MATRESGRIRDADKKRVLDDVTRKRRARKALEALEQDNYHEGEWSLQVINNSHRCRPRRSARRSGDVEKDPQIQQPTRAGSCDSHEGPQVSWRRLLSCQVSQDLSAAARRGSQRESRRAQLRNRPSATNEPSRAPLLCRLWLSLQLHLHKLRHSLLLHSLSVNTPRHSLPQVCLLRAALLPEGHS